MLKKHLWILLIAVFILHGVIPFGCIAEAGEQQNSTSVNRGDSLIITGSSTMCTMMSEIGKRFQSLRHGVRVDVQCGGSERGIKDVRSGAADIGMVSRSFSDQENDLYGFPIARDGVSIIVHKDNTVKTLSDSQLEDIFTGRITRWEQVKGSSGPITVVLREPQKASTEILIAYFKIKTTDLTGTVVLGDNPVTIAELKKNRKAIGYVSSGYAENTIAAGVPIRILPVNNVMPSRRNIISANYPMSRPLMLITRKLPAGLAKDFIDYSLSSTNVDIIESFNYVPYED